jgi:hypothetical protein
MILESRELIRINSLDAQQFDADARSLARDCHALPLRRAAALDCGRSARGAVDIDGTRRARSAEAQATPIA